ncbi:MAG: dolichol kinase [Cyanobacteriota bacterium]|nr:dolichol kinase [Cyanobacteriota bacterium]
MAAIAAWLAVLSLSALWVRRCWDAQREWSRKLIHIGAGAVAPLAWWLGIEAAVAVPAAGVVTLMAALNHRMRVLPAIEDIDRASYGTVAYGASITLLLWLYWPVQPSAVTAGVLVMALGDGLAGLVGPAVPSLSWHLWKQRKSLAGTGAMAAASLVVLVGLRAFCLDQGLPTPGLPALVGITAAAVSLEQVAVLGIDNFTVPMAVGCLWNSLAH